VSQRDSRARLNALGDINSRTKLLARRVRLILRVKPIPSVSMLLTTALVILPACAASRARRLMDIHTAEMQLASTEAWKAARVRLHAMCPEIPRSMEALERAMSVPNQNGCSLRFLKASNAPTWDDWHWYWLPPYQIIVAVHDEELRQRVTPKLYEEYMLALTRYLAEKADNGEITAGQLKHALNVGLHWLYGKAQEEELLLQESVYPANPVDAAIWNRVNNVAAGLGFIATTALVASGEASGYPATPTNCYVLPTGNRNYSIQCY
jgi:hypothetical protein